MSATAPLSGCSSNVSQESPGGARPAPLRSPSNDSISTVSSGEVPPTPPASAQERAPDDIEESEAALEDTRPEEERRDVLAVPMELQRRSVPAARQVWSLLAILVVATALLVGSLSYLNTRSQRLSLPTFRDVTPSHALVVVETKQADAEKSPDVREMRRRLAYMEEHYRTEKRQKEKLVEVIYQQNQTILDLVDRQLDMQRYVAEVLQLVKVSGQMLPPAALAGLVGGFSLSLGTSWVTRKLFTGAALQVALSSQGLLQPLAGAPTQLAAAEMALNTVATKAAEGSLAKLSHLVARSSGYAVGVDLRRVENTLADLSKAQTQVRGEVVTAQTEQLQQDLDRVGALHRQLQQDHGDLQRRLQEVMPAWEQAQRERDQISELLRSSNQAHEQVQQDRDRLSELLRRANNGREESVRLYKDVQQSLQQLQRRHTTLSDQYHKAVEAFEASEMQRAALQSQADALRLQQDQQVAYTQQLGLERDNLVVEREQLQLAREEWLEEREVLVESVQRLQREREGLVLEREGLQQAREDMLEERGLNQQSLQQLQRERENLSQEREELLEAREDLLHELETLQQSLQQVRDERDHVGDGLRQVQEQLRLARENSDILQEERDRVLIDAEERQLVLEEARDRLQQTHEQLEQVIRERDAAQRTANNEAVARETLEIARAQAHQELEQAWHQTEILQQQLATAIEARDLAIGEMDAAPAQALLQTGQLPPDAGVGVEECTLM